MYSSMHGVCVEQAKANSWAWETSGVVDLNPTTRPGPMLRSCLLLREKCGVSQLLSRLGMSLPGYLG